ncbi:MAG: DNA-3-methyladenine glycosylase I [Candidatus Eremiobacteraeota bacterium]|nr:DNA-3-methyladenine glycosylase I [Candidatus Eremiobacteraeota bacterium]
MIRCAWATTDLLTAYHDQEWGKPLHDDRRLFELLVLEGAQAGLSWQTILGKREGYRGAFAGFDYGKVAHFGPAKQTRLLANPGIVRNRAKIASAVGNARAFLAVREEWGTFDAYLWRFVDGKPVRRRPANRAEVPASTPLSDAISTDLKRRGFSFVGTTIIYAFLQAAGVVDDHVAACAFGPSKVQR